MNKIALKLVKIAREIYSSNKSYLLSQINIDNVLYPTLKSLLQGKINTQFIENLNLRNMQSTKQWTKQFQSYCYQILNTIPLTIKDQCCQLNDEQMKKLCKSNIIQIKTIRDNLNHKFSSLVDLIKQMPDETNEFGIDFSSWKI